MALGGSPSGQYSENTRPPRRSRRLPFSRELTVGLVAAGVGFVLSLNTYSQESVNGVVTQCTSTNFSPLVLGPAAGVAGIVAIIRCRRQDRKTALELGLGVLLLVLCAVHIARGVGVIGGPCN